MDLLWQADNLTKENSIIQKVRISIRAAMFAALLFLGFFFPYYIVYKNYFLSDGGRNQNATHFILISIAGGQLKWNVYLHIAAAALRQGFQVHRNRLHKRRRSIRNVITILHGNQLGFLFYCGFLIG